jgi:membrane-associated phospholipid phosphatase
MERKNNSKFLLVDKATLIYMIVLSLLILVFSANQKNWLFYVIFNLGVCASIVLIVNATNHNSNPWIRFFRHFYPLPFFILLYQETRNLVHIIFPGWFDPFLNHLELKTFSVYPTVWMQKFVFFPLLNEYLMFTYFFYYFLLLVLGLEMFFENKIEELDNLTFTSAVAYYISFLGFILFPVEGPKYALIDLHNLNLEGAFFTPLAQGLIKVAGIHGGAMPSSHVAVALVVLVYAKRHQRFLYYILFPLIMSLFVSTVYGRFHYVSDVLAGLLVGWGSILLCDKIIRRVQANSRRQVSEKIFSLDLVRSE